MPEPKTTSRFAKYASTWMKFEDPGDKIAGTLLTADEEIGQTSGDPYPVLKLETDEGERGVRASQVHLQQLLAEQEPQDSDWIEIELVGFQQTAMGKMKRFTLTVTRAGEAF
jgi:hypothetical protein